MIVRELTDSQVERLEAIAEVRRNAKKAARSGNPAKSGPAKRVLTQIPLVIRQTYYGFGA